MDETTERVPASLIDEDRQRRLAAIDSIALGEASIHALRSALALDDDAEVRARAAGRLASATAVTRLRPALLAAVEEALCDALGDASSPVREAAARAAGRLRARRCEARLREAIRFDSSFRARRAAVRALASVAGERALGAIVDALDDPFWRVRHAAIQVLAKWPEGAIAMENGGSPRRRAAIAYLEALRRGVSEIELPAAVVEEGRGEIADDDPAVTAARLAALPVGAARGDELVGFLASPHDSLRRLAARRLIARRDRGELLAALAWLDEPRVPYAAAAVARVLRKVDGRRLAAAALSAGSAAGPGVRAWALEEAARLEDEGLLRGALESATHSDVRLRRAAVRGLAELGAITALRNALTDEDEACRAEAIWGLGRAEVGIARILEGLGEAGRAGLLVERALAAIARADSSKEAEEVLRAALGSSWSDVRAQALAALAKRGRLDEAARAGAAADADPWIRGAVLDLPMALERLEFDPDPGVRRASMDVIVRGRKGMADSDRRRAALAGARSDDPAVRARAAGLFDEDEESFGELLLLTRDSTSMVRVAASGALERFADLRGRCASLLQQEGVAEAVRLAAHAQLLRNPDAQAFDALVKELESELSPAAREALMAMSLVYPEAVRARAPQIAYVPRARARVEAPPAITIEDAPRRELGKSGIAVSPLGISGAFELSPLHLQKAREAGVNLFFWEPEYRALGEFVARAPRRHELVIVAGSYEADPKSIEKDVDRALQRLGVESLGVMLLFWVRSRARLGDEAYSTLERLKRAGKIWAMGFSTHLREVAVEAIEARPWDVVMCRLSAAHTGAEKALLPAAAARGVGVLGFSALVYGRMLTDPETGASVAAADCYRYCLSQPGVSACLSAPRRWDELEENLGVLRRPTLDADAIARLRAHGARVHAANRAFTELVRRPG